MEKYSLYCTEAQTKKAFELGAPISANISYSDGNVDGNRCVYGDIVDKDGWGIGKYTILHIPTAEQMIGWLEEHIDSIEVIKGADGIWLYVFYPTNSSKHEIKRGYHSRKEATLASIDIALEYLANNH